MVKECETTVSKIINYDKKNEFLEDFREISLVGSLNIKKEQGRLCQGLDFLKRNYKFSSTRTHFRYESLLTTTHCTNR